MPYSLASSTNARTSCSRLLHINHDVTAVTPVAELEERNLEPRRRAKDGPRGRIRSRSQLGGNHRHFESVRADSFHGARQILSGALRKDMTSRPHRQIDAVKAAVTQPFSQFVVLQFGQVFGEEADRRAARWRLRRQWSRRGCE